MPKIAAKKSRTNLQKQDATVMRKNVLFMNGKPHICQSKMELSVESLKR